MKLCVVVTFKHLPQPLRSHIRSFGTLEQLLEFSKNKKRSSRGPGVVSKFFWGSMSPFFVRINPLWSFRTLTDLLLIFSKQKIKKPKNRPQGGQWVGSDFYFLPNFLLILVRSPCNFLLPQILFFCDLKPHAKFWNPTLLGEKYVAEKRKKEKEEEIITKIVDTSFHCNA
jgi:hypothetical protein